MGSDMFGAAGDDITLSMPVGTIITDAETGEVLSELLEPDEKVMIAKGGDGGFGNMRFKSTINRAPRQKTPGWPGEQKNLKLELKRAGRRRPAGHAQRRQVDADHARSRTRGRRSPTIRSPRCIPTWASCASRPSRASSSPTSRA